MTDKMLGQNTKNSNLRRFRWRLFAQFSALLGDIWLDMDFQLWFYGLTRIKEGLTKRLSCVIPLVFLLCFVVGCQDKEAMAELENFKAQAAVEEQNMDLMKSWLIGVGTQRNLALIDQICAPQCTFHYRGQTSVMDLEGLKSMVSRWHQAYSDYTNDVQDVFASGDKVVARSTIRGTQDGPWYDLPPSGKKIEVTENLIARVENGKIVEFWPDEDVLTRWQQLGYTFMSPQTAQEKK